MNEQKLRKQDSYKFKYILDTTRLPPRGGGAITIHVYEPPGSVPITDLHRIIYSGIDKAENDFNAKSNTIVLSYNPWE